VLPRLLLRLQKFIVHVSVRSSPFFPPRYDSLKEKRILGLCGEIPLFHWEWNQRSQRAFPTATSKEAMPIHVHTHVHTRIATKNQKKTNNEPSADEGIRLANKVVDNHQTTAKKKKNVCARVSTTPSFVCICVCVCLRKCMCVQGVQTLHLQFSDQHRAYLHCLLL
jgi:hypothetical protein